MYKLIVIVMGRMFFLMPGDVLLEGGKVLLASLYYRFIAVSQKLIAINRDNGDMINLSFLLFDSRFKITLSDR